VLKGVIDEFGPSSTTNGLLGRIYRDRWEVASKEGRPEARSLLKRAIDTYRQGFEADWRDSSCGLNALMLMEMQDKPDSAQMDLLPVVRYSALQRAHSSRDYWDHAMLLELAVLARNIDEAEETAATA